MGAIVKATGDDDRLVGFKRVVKTLQDTFEDDPERLEELNKIADELAEFDADTDDSLLGLWLDRVRRDHSELLPYFDERTELPLLEQVFVQLHLRGERHLHPPEAEAEGLGHFGRSLTLPEILELTERQVPGTAGSFSATREPARPRSCVTWRRVSRSRRRAACRSSILCRG